jgi:hypothetical protein
LDKTNGDREGTDCNSSEAPPKVNIKQGTPIHIFELNGEIVLRPITDVYIRSCAGMTGTKGKLLKVLMQEKKRA